MGCVKCNQNKESENNKNTEIIYDEPGHHRANLLRNGNTKNFILESLNSQILTDFASKKELPLENEKKIIELTEQLKLDAKKMRLLRICQSHILGMQLRRKLRIENLKKSESLSLNLLSKKNFPLSKEEMNKFFEENPEIKKKYLKLERKEPLLLDNGIIYYGEWDMNFFTRHGRGIQIWPDDSYYKGYWENNKAEGKGEFIHSNGDIYIGKWHENKRHGMGIYRSKKGIEYNGPWVNDKREGKGKEEWEDGSTYNGYYLKGKKNGKGIMQWANGCIYKGNFENGNINGKGIYTYADKRVYEGYFVNNKFEGKGMFTWPNGNKYHGYYKNDKREGFGIFTFADGKILKGMWKEGKQEGEFDIYQPKKRKWIKKKYKEYENEKENDICFIHKQESLEKEREKMIEDLELKKIDEIKKTEDNKINELDEEDF